MLLLGWYNHGVSPAILERCERLREKGMFRQLAISGHHRPSFVDYASDPRFSLLHLRYNAANSGAERDVFPALPAENRPGIVVYTATRWRKLLDPAYMPPGEAPLSAADCYRFVLSNTNVQVCMSGPADDAQMDEALSILDAGPLAAEEDRRVRRIGAYVHQHARWWRP